MILDIRSHVPSFPPLSARSTRNSVRVTHTDGTRGLASERSAKRPRFESLIGWRKFWGFAYILVMLVAFNSLLLLFMTSLVFRAVLWSSFKRKRQETDVQGKPVIDWSIANHATSKRAEGSTHYYSSVGARGRLPLFACVKLSRRFLPNFDVKCQENTFFRLQYTH